MKHLNEALSKSTIKKLKKHDDKYILLWITALHVRSALKHFPALKKYSVSNSVMPYSSFYLISINFAKDIIKPISAIDRDLDIFEITFDDGVNYDEIKETINIGVDLDDVKKFTPLKINVQNSEKKITFTFLGHKL